MQTPVQLRLARAMDTVRGMSYRPHELLAAPARPTSSVGRLIGGVLATVALFFLLGSFYSSLEASLLPGDVHEQLRADLARASTPASALVNLYFFALMSLALAISLRIIHRRGLLSLVGPPPLALVQFGTVVWALIKLSVAIYLLTLFFPTPEALTPELNMAFGQWMLLLPLTLLGLLIQTSAEELVFRGYLQSQIAARFSNPLVWILIPSLLFALLHYDPDTQGSSAWLIVFWAGAFGIAAADLTARSGTLGPAIALHMINNAAAIALTAPQGNFDGVALYTYPFAITDSAILWAWMPVEMMMLLCSWLVARLALRC